MLNYIEYLNVPARVALILAGLFFMVQIIGEILEFKGKVVPEFIKIRKYFIRKKNDRKMVEEVSKTLNKIQTTFDNIETHYNEDNITMRDAWMKQVNDTMLENGREFQKINTKIDKNSEVILSLLIESKRSTIISFASRVIDINSPVTREEFKRIFKLHEEYERIIKENGRTNGEVDVAFRIITESYEEHMRNHTFVEDVRGYNNV